MIHNKPILKLDNYWISNYQEPGKVHISHATKNGGAYSTERFEDMLNEFILREDYHELQLKYNHLVEAYELLKELNV